MTPPKVPSPRCRSRGGWLRQQGASVVVHVSAQLTQTDDRIDQTMSGPTATNDVTPISAAGLGGRDVFIARQPIFNRTKGVHAYELLFRGGLENFCPPGDANKAASETIQAAWLTFGLPTLIGQKKAFTNFTRDLLVAGHAQALPAESTIIELLETIDGDPEVLAACRHLKEKGYALALDDFVYRSALDPLIALADIIKIGFGESDPAEQAEHVRRVAPHGPKLLAEKVETHEEYGLAKSLGFDYFQGYFFCKPETIQGRALSGTSLTYLKLLQCVTKRDFDIDELESIIGIDVAVTHTLMKYLGSAAFSFRAEVRDIRHGLVLLGREQARRFVALVALGVMGRHKPSEILVTAAARAKFCELVGDDLGLTDRRSELFLMGALSLVDAMLDRPMAEVLSELPLAADLEQALLGCPSPLRPALEFVERYEQGDWAACARLENSTGVSGVTAYLHYREAVFWATSAWQA